MKIDQLNMLADGGIQRIYKFENGYGASAVCSPWSYGGPQGLWEVAVLGGDGEITYSTPLTGDVIGFLDDAGLADTLNVIRMLPAA
jgi:hypothetical protein